MSTLLIMEQVSPTPSPNNRFRIVEMYISCDGPRTRLTHRSFPTIERAQAFVANPQDVDLHGSTGPGDIE